MDNNKKTGVAEQVNIGENAEKKPSGKKGSRSRSIEMMFRPVFDVSLNMAIDFEASIRIYDRLMGVMLPEYYLPVAEKSNQICELNRWSVEEACDAMIRCEKREADINCVILPLSVKYLAKNYFLSQVTKIVEKKDIAPDKICFNIDESILEYQKDAAIANIKEAREYGFLVSIDDLGVEFTSMSNLAQYEVDYLGLDSVLIKGVLEDEKLQNRLQGIIEFANKVGMKVRADGVDSVEIAELLKKFGVMQMKGELYGKPLHERMIKI